MKRAEVLDQLKKNNQVTVLVVGAGINGIGTFRDLALNGVNVLLIDRSDFCSGASTASSHMAHGGIRYLENGEFRLVREAVQERNRMIENAPHVVRPLPTVIPIFKFWSGLLNAPLKFLNWLDKPAERGAFVIKFGLIMYDSFTHKQKTVPTHEFYGRKRSLQMYPRLNPQIKYTALYYDGQILSPERYAMDLISDAEAEGPHARALNYVSLVGKEGENVVLKDEVTGETFTVQAKIIVNAAGPWIDSVNREMGIEERYIGGTKGSHLVLDLPELRQAIGNKEFFFENKDGRIVLIFPFWDKVIIGTSDLPIENPDEARCTPEEEQYFINLVSRVFPDIPVKPEHIVFRFTGVRPLEYSRAKTTGQISRDHSIKEDKLGNIPVLSLVGGKWTSFRAFSEQTTDVILKMLDKKRTRSTAALGVGGGKDFPRNDKERAEMVKYVCDKTGVKESVVQDLFVRYGTRSLLVAKEIARVGDSPLQSKANWQRGEVIYLVENEKPVHVEDVLLRRSTLAWLGEVTRPLVEEFAAIFAEVNGWSKATVQSEVERTIAHLKEYHGVIVK
ncbi:MAG: glycerol-3-phosphate dehydrogenase/oxidase [Anaerolineaceae bacterium]|nr:glycerol-3-phosphate dehydrogenase/oxidase [Anaerolineaceae bacterium]